MVGKVYENSIVMGWDYGIWDMGYGIWDMGYGIWDMGYGIWDMGYGIWDMGYGIWDGSIHVDVMFTARASALDILTVFFVAFRGPVILFLRSSSPSRPIVHCSD
ncbi:hypothetical protein ACN38_g7457 [Penicillium nordicum]|uniref:Uncharacterized protein n=1 Tax=Penicillium nordicum TaxID=229535 RepID=A0A0M8P6F2_9EURO|nr:hypothetical protein ACN38_g7457 [Penicillium nordicum]